MQNIHVLLRFANSYWWFIQKFSRIAASLIIILKVLESIESISQPGEDRVKVGDNNRTKRNGRYKLGSSEVEGDEVNSGEFIYKEVGKKDQKITMSKTLSKSKKR